ncbi:hypothetical protein LEP1GSC047_0536 [Leptospira inadai serovar Lyme str. 10]|uniref:DUF5683 domain-containing protein n=2 Tax=Leptospira inadai serovar Lyme TaxID=293084 RepID=V6H9I2_9LEPT|nr:DUF5683 domain-containing protein [Leptospira inadai]EQA35816.1 hypothetical protein LEP1GSC047_0536 [Leptospira inadai serovar Lyme str. 10]PNV76999.1 hypothetical protein BES34_001630 [Leptospira inadai serovar Lyme]
MVSSAFRTITTVLILFLLPAAIFPVTILLREGGKVKGDLVTQNQASVIIQTESGKRAINKKLILKVLYKDVSDDEEAKIRAAEEKKIANTKREVVEKEKARQLQQDEADRLRREEEQRKVVPAASKQDAIEPGKALLRSAVLPGWGQFYSDRKVFGILWPTLFAAAGFASYDKYRVYRNAVRDYGTLGNPYSQTGIIGTALGINAVYMPPTSSDPVTQYILDKNYNLIRQKRAEADRDFQHYQEALYALGAIYLLNLVDAYFFANFGRNLVKVSDGTNSGLVLSVLPSNIGQANLSSTGSSSASFLETKYSFGYRFSF